MVIDFQLYWDFGFICLYTGILDLFKVWFCIFNCTWILNLFDLWGVSNCDHYWLFTRPIKKKKTKYVWFVVFLDIFLTFRKPHENKKKFYVWFVVFLRIRVICSFFHSNCASLSATFSNFKANNKRVFKFFLLYLGILQPYYRVFYRLFGPKISLILIFFYLENVELCDF